MRRYRHLTRFGVIFSFLVLPGYVVLPALAQTFQGIERVPGWDDTIVTNVSADGRVLVGFVRQNAGFGVQRAFRWEDGLVELLPNLSGFAASEAVGVSGDGSVVIGSSCKVEPDFVSSTCRGVRWKNGTVTVLGYIENEADHQAFAVSASGEVAAGWYYNSVIRWWGTAAAWAATSDLVAYPHAISDDGSVIAASDHKPQRGDIFGYYSSFLYRIVGQSVTRLPITPGAMGAAVLGMSGDGSVIVGAVREADNWSTPVQWGPAGLKELALPDSALDGTATAASYDGSVVVGEYLVKGFRSRPVVWRSGEPMDVIAFLEAEGIDVADLDFGTPTGVSADGTVIVGRLFGSDAFSSYRIKLPVKLIVNDLRDENDAAPADGRCDVDLNEEGRQCTLRAAIQTANLLDEAHVIIEFDIPSGQTQDGNYYISVLEPLDAITRPVTIDGTTQSGYGEQSPVVVVGSPASLTPASEGRGLKLATDRSEVKGLWFMNDHEAALTINGNDNRILSNRFEANVTGIRVESGSGNAIGGCEDDAYIGNNFADNDIGVLLEEDASENEVLCNAIWSTVGEQLIRYATQTGILLRNSSSNLIARNVVSGLHGIGIALEGAKSSDNRVDNNGLGELGPNIWGIVVNGSRNEIGGTDNPGIIYESVLGGVLILSDASGAAADGNVIHNLWIGTNLLGEVEAGDPKGDFGILLGAGATGNQIGRPGEDGSYSLIVGNHRVTNVGLFTPLAVGNSIESALIGFGTEVMSGRAFNRSYPATYGIWVEGAIGTRIGSLTSEYATRPSVQLGRHNDSHIHITGESESVVTLNGRIESQQYAPVNTLTEVRGVRIRHSGLSCSGAAATCDITVGGILLYRDGGVKIGPQVSIEAPASGIALTEASGNEIVGTELKSYGARDYAAGMRLSSSSDNRIGASGTINLFGTDTSLGNRITGWDLGLVSIGDRSRTPSHANRILGNVFDGKAPDESRGRGVVLSRNVTDTVIGGPGEGEGNLFLDTETGIVLEGPKPPFREPLTGTIISGNTFDVADAAVGVIGTAIEVLVAEHTRIGGTVSGGSTGGNTIRNQRRGVVVQRHSSQSHGTAILGNSIYDITEKGILTWSAAADFMNDPLQLPIPSILETQSDNGVVIATGKLLGRPNRTYVVQYFSSDGCRSVGEGKNYLTYQTVETGGLGIASLQVPMMVSDGAGLTATATDVAENRTSELSLCYTHTGSAQSRQISFDAAAGETLMNALGLVARMASAGKNAAVGTLFVTAYPEAPAADRFSGQAARSPEETSILPRSAVGRYWRVGTDGVSDELAMDLCFDASGLPATAAGETVVIQRSARSGGHWIPHDTHLEVLDGSQYACARGVLPTGDFSFGSGEAALLSAPLLILPSDNQLNVGLPATLSWEPATDAAHYDLQIALDAGFSAAVVDTSALMDASATPDSLQPGALYFWRVRGVTANGEVGPWSNSFRFATEGISLDAAEESALPAAFTLHPNYPNPFNPRTTIAYTLSRAAHVRLAVYDMLGRQVAQLANGLQSAGYHQVQFDASSLTTGVYIYRVQADEFTEARRMVLVK